MGIGFIIIGVIFLFNPMVSLLDVLPDFIGYLFILIGIYKLADMTNKMDKIHKHILYVAGISVVRLVLSIVIVNDDNVLALIFVFVFAIIDAVFMISVFNKIFDGIEDIGTRFPNTSVFTKLSETVRTLTCVFVIVRSLFTLIPEFRHLSMTDYEGEILSTEMLGRADYTYMLLILNVVVVILIGTVWLGMTITYFNRIRKDSEFVTAVSDNYTNVILADSKRFLIRRIMLSMMFLMAGFVFLVDIFFTNVDVLPDFVGAGFILAAAILLRKNNSLPVSVIFTAAAYIPVSLAYWILRVLFAGNEYRVKQLLRTEVLQQFIILIALALVSAVLLIFIFYNLNKMFKRMISEIVANNHEEHFKKLIEQHNESIKKKNQANTALFYISGVLALSKVVQTAAMILLPEYWMIHFVIQIFWILRIYMFIPDLYEEIKYSLDIGVEKI